MTRNALVATVLGLAAAAALPVGAGADDRDLPTLPGPNNLSVRILGEPRVGATLKAHVEHATKDEPGFLWLRCDADGLACSGISQSGDTYRIAAEDAGSTLRVHVRVIGRSKPAIVLSAPTAVIKPHAAGSDAPPSSPSEPSGPPSQAGPALAAGPLVSVRSGRSFRAMLRVRGVPASATAVTVRCAARIGRKGVNSTRSAFARGAAVCVWRLPHRATGWVAGRVTVRYDGRTLTKRFRVRLLARR